MTDTDPTSERDEETDGRSDTTGEPGPEAEATRHPTAEAVDAVSERLAAAAEKADDGSEPTLLIGTDFDGTLAPITDRPGEAAIRPESREALRALRENERTEVVVISGRALEDVSERVGVEGIDYAGNHGLEYRHGDETNVHPVACERAKTIQAVREALEEELAGIEGAHVEDKRVTLTVHHRHAAPEDVGRVRKVVESTVERLGGDELEITDGKAIVEVRPDVDWNKGEALAWFADQHEDDVVPVFIGDDVSDEAGFRAAAPRGAGVRVGGDIDRESDAAAAVETPAEVTELLRRIDEGPLTYGGEARRRASGDDGDGNGAV